MGLHARADHHGIEWLGDVVHPAHLKAHGFVFVIAEGGDEDDGNLAGARVGLQTAADLKAVETWHHHVEQD